MDQLSEMLGKLKERSSTSLPIQNIFKYQIGKMMEYGYIYILWIIHDGPLPPLDFFKSCPSPKARELDNLW
jgi:hypothetical protein